MSGGRRDADSDLPWNAKCFWMDYSYGSFHPRAVFVGLDKDGGNLYVGRFAHRGDLLPGKIVPNHSCAYAAWEGQEIRAHTYEVLVLGTGAAEWQSASDGHVPARALPVGLTHDGEVSFSARVRLDGTTTPGKLIPSQQVCRISYDVKEWTFREYEVLVVS